MLLAVCLLGWSSAGDAADDIFNTKTLKVGDVAPGGELLKKPLAEGKSVILVLLPSEKACEGCSFVVAAVEEMEKKHPEMAFIIKGGEGVQEVFDPDVVMLKRSYGVQMTGVPWTIYINSLGKVRKITTGVFNGPEMESYFVNLKWVKP
ncbi:MAG: hypothetical protein HY280_05165 [Nitrospinae bacterium]|nr:hypothetical protein [Nitrospinota bacterium]